MKSLLNVSVLAAAVVLSTGVRAEYSAADAALQQRVDQALAASPVTHGLLVDVDMWNGLAVLHGWTLTRSQRRDVERAVAGIEGVERVYNYMLTDEDVDGPYHEAYMGYRITVGRLNEYDSDVRSTSLYPINPPVVMSAASPLGRVVKYRVDIEPFSGIHEVRVDEYNGLVILHGQAPSLAFAREAESIAAHTAGVKRVYSYIQTPEVVERVRTDWPVVVELDHEYRRDRFTVQPRYARYEERVEYRGGCDRCEKR